MADAGWSGSGSGAWFPAPVEVGFAPSSGAGSRTPNRGFFGRLDARRALGGQTVTVSTTPHAPVAVRQWLRVLVLALALVLPAAHGTAHAGGAPPVAGETALVEYDLVETASRPPSRHHQRPAAATRPAPPAAGSPVPATAERPPLAPVPPRPPSVPHVLRSVVLRC